MPVLQKKNITQTRKTVGIPGRQCTQAKIWLGKDLSRASWCLSMLIKTTLTLIKRQLEITSCPYNFFLLVSSSTFLWLKKKKSSNFQSNLLMANLPPFCSCTTKHFNILFFFLFQLCIIYTGIIKTSIHLHSLKNTQQSFRNCDCVHNAGYGLCTCPSTGGQVLS